MKKILATGKFSGAIVLKYGESGMGDDLWPPLLSVDFTGVALKDQYKVKFLSMLPMRYGAGFEQSWGVPPPMKFTDADVELDFDEDFYIPFGKKVHKKRCEERWNRMSKADKANAVRGMNAYVRYLGQNQWQNKMLPSRFLIERCWETDWDNVQ